MRITDEGNVGIGISSPLNTLDISGNVSGGSNSNSQSLFGYAYIGHTPGKDQFASIGHFNLAILAHPCF